MEGEARGNEAINGLALAEEFRERSRQLRRSAVRRARQRARPKLKISGWASAAFHLFRVGRLSHRRAPRGVRRLSALSEVPGRR